MTQTLAPRRAPARARTRFGDHVAEEVAALQTGYLLQEAAAIATLARLRAAAGTLAGGALETLHATQVPEEFLPAVPADTPIAVEHAKHVALTLFAVHQQSCKDTRLHRDGYGLGDAIAALAFDSTNPEAVRRRFAALGTADTVAETLHHLRAFIRLLRDQRIALDYGLLADDLTALQDVDGPEKVRAWWGREYYRTLNRLRAEAKKKAAVDRSTETMSSDFVEDDA